jgi:hypothetical protein
MCLWAYLPLQTSVVEDSRSSGKSRGDEAIQSAGKERNALPELHLKKSAISSNDIMRILNSGFREKIFFQI